jgi:hypothetical protein
MPNWDADAELHVLAQMQTEQRMSPRYVKSGKFKALVTEVMAKRPADRRAYSITVRDKVFNADAIEDLSEQIG